MMFLTSVIKNQSRLMEKQIALLKENISLLKNNLHEAQLDFYYLSSPDSLSKKISMHGGEKYENMNYSNIFFGINHYLGDKKKITKTFKNEKKVEK